MLHCTYLFDDDVLSQLTCGPTVHYPLSKQRSVLANIETDEERMDWQNVR